jgi:hypothetical protein
LSDSVTNIDPTAFLFRLTEQFRLWLLVSDPLGQDTLVNTASVVNVMFEVCVPPFKVAVIVAVSSAEKLLMVAGNVALDEPLLTVTLAGTVTRALLLDRVTEVLDAAFEASATVQVVLPAAVKLVCRQLKPLRPAGATRLIVVDWLTLFNRPVTAAVSLVAMVPTLTLN